MKRDRLKIPYSDPETDKLCFLAWFSEGSLKKAQIKLAKDGVVSSRELPYTTDGVCKAAVRHMIRNYEETKKMMLDTYAKNGYFVGEENIERYLIKLAAHSFKNSERMKFWLIQNNLYGKHKEFISSLVTIQYD